MYEEYVAFIKKYCSLLNKISDLMGSEYYIYDDKWKNLPLEELKKINYGIYEPLKQKSRLLLDKSDEIHKYMSVVAFLIATDYKEYVFNRNFKQIDNFKKFLYKVTDALNLENPEILKKVIIDYNMERLPFKVDDSIKSIYTDYLLKDVILNSDLNQYNYLYLTGKYITNNELQIVDYFNKLSKEEIVKMAKTVVDGFLRGYKNQNLDFSTKDFVVIYYPLGFEKMAKEVYNLLQDKTNVVFKIGNSTICNKQINFFHKNDCYLYINNDYVEKLLNIYNNVFEKYKNMLCEYGGPLWIETFGEKQFNPKYEFLFDNDEEKNKLLNKIKNEYSILFSQYTNSESRSFTIISYPCPDIGTNFEKIFDATVELNNLDNNLYEKIQDKIIDTLDKGDYVLVKGKDQNKTNMKVNLIKLYDPDKETIFENCTADVNIPVGEVFTTPVLSGTNGILNVSNVYLNGLKYKDLEIEFEDGRVVNYNCSNFESEKANKEFIKQNILYNYETLPIGEFAIGTNTAAYKMAKKYNIESKLDILIAEKTGPHFALGDTCYKNQEDLRLTNPNGKEIIAKENDYSKLRYTEPNKAYFGCHTDITIPFDELEYIKVVTKEGKEIAIIEDGLFVLEGTTQLNEALYECNSILKAGN